MAESGFPHSEVSACGDLLNQATSGLVFIDGAAVRAALTFETCIPLMAEAMKALSAGLTRQLPRTFVPLVPGNVLALMAGALGENGFFGAKLLSVFADRAQNGRSRHRGVVVLFEPVNGRAVCVADAEEITRVRTACASAMATNVLARPEAANLAIFGCGTQAVAHASAIALVRPLASIRIWGRSGQRAREAASLISDTTGVSTRPFESAQATAEGADIICTTTGAKEPILRGEWLTPGTHINLVGSSGAGATEVDSELVRRSRYFVESRETAAEKATEFVRARLAGIVGDEHIAGEIGEVLLGTRPGRLGLQDITVYKSMGHAIQDLRAAAFLYEHLQDCAIRSETAS